MSERCRPVFTVWRLEFWLFEDCDEMTFADVDSRDAPFKVLKKIAFGFYWRKTP